MAYPTDPKWPTSQPFGGGATQGVDPNGNDPMAGLVRQYGNYQPYGHAGMDIACPEGSPVYAIASGTVLWAGWGTGLPGDESNAGYRQRWYLYKSFPGIVTVIQHPWGKGVYAHKSAAWMNVGDTVTEGQQIGLSGGTGGVAPHLHVEALIDDSYTTGGGLIYGRTDPTPYFGQIATQGTITPQEDKMTDAQMLELKLFIQDDNERRAVVTREVVIEAIKNAGFDIKVFAQSVDNQNSDRTILDARDQTTALKEYFDAKAAK